MLDRLERRLNLSVAASRPPRGYAHPWQVRGRWSEERRAWQIRLVPATVNAAEVEVPAMPRAEAPAATRSRLRSGSRVRPWLSERPWIVVSPDRLRAIGSDAAPQESPPAIPRYFAERGVGAGPTLRIDPVGGVTVSEAPVPDPKQLRRLRTAVVVLRVPKPTVRPEIATDARGITRLTPLLSPASGAPSISVAPRWDPVPDSIPLQAQLVAGLSDPPDFERLVATLYWMSPPGAPSGSAPDARWTFYSDQTLFWDLFWAWRADLYAYPEQNLGLSPGLAGGAGQQAIDVLLDDLNASHAAAATALSRASVEIIDWTL